MPVPRAPAGRASLWQHRRMPIPSGARTLATRACALLLVLPLVGARAAAPSRSPKPPADSMLRLEGVLDSLRLARGVPGLAAAVIEGGNVVAIGAAGVPWVGATRPLTVDDPLHIGSCTKSMTAVMIAELVEKKRITWTTSLAEAFPQLMPEMLPVYRNIKLEQLLTHRGGIPAYEDVDDDTLLAMNAVSRSPVSARYAFVRRVIQEAPHYDTGAAYDYSNAGYTLAAAMIENKSGKSWEYWMQDVLFTPLGMTSAGFGWPTDRRHADRPRGHRCDDSTGVKVVELDDTHRLGAVLGPGGDVHASIRDLARYVAFQLDGAEGRPTEPSLSAEGWRRIDNDPDGAAEGYAMGWQVLPGEGERPMLFHDGTAGTFYTRILIQPAHDRAVVIATNVGPPCGKSACEQGLTAVLAAVKRLRTGPR